jgi:hypothetical protein
MPSVYYALVIGEDSSHWQDSESTEMAMNDKPMAKKVGLSIVEPNTRKAPIAVINGKVDTMTCEIERGMNLMPYV